MKVKYRVRRCPGPCDLSVPHWQVIRKGPYDLDVEVAAKSSFAEAIEAAYRQATTVRSEVR